MYYYILETPPTRAVRQTYQKIRDLLTQLSIAGEMVASSPARTPTELAEMGMAKGYSTIVAVGGDYHINEVATAVVGRAALGVIPINASNLVTDIIGLSGIHEAAIALKQRRLSSQSTVLIEPETIIFLDTVIETPKLAKISMILDNRVRTHAYFNKLTINRFLELRLESAHLTEAKKILGIFNTGGRVIHSESHFHAKSARVLVDPPLEATVAGEPIAKTPIQLRLLPDSLKIITKRGTILE